MQFIIKEYLITDPAKRKGMENLTSSYMESFLLNWIEYNVKGYDHYLSDSNINDIFHEMGTLEYCEKKVFGSTDTQATRL